MGSFSYCYLQLLLWPPAYKSRCQVSLEFILLHSESLPFLLSPPILTYCIPTVSALDTHSVRCLWTIFMLCAADSCMFGSGGQEWCLGCPWRFGNHAGAVGILDWVCYMWAVCVHELWWCNLVERIYSLVKTQRNPCPPRPVKRKHLIIEAVTGPFFFFRVIPQMLNIQ